MNKPRVGSSSGKEPRARRDSARIRGVVDGARAGAPSERELGDRAALRAAAPEHYRVAPMGCYLSLRGTLAFCAGPALWGFAIWGAPRGEDIEQLASFVALDLAPGVAPHAILVDLRGLEGGDLPAFAPLIQHATAQPGLAATRVTRMAVVRPRGLLGMTIAGFFQVVRVPYAVQIFAELSEAAAWAGAAPPLCAPLDALLRSVRASDPALAQLRAWLDAHVADATLASAARALARSRRSLQRDLHLAGSSFRAELLDARVRQAKHQLLHTAASLTEIAHDVGCASLQHFSVLFRARTGQTPSRWRAHQRDTPDHLDRGRAEARALAHVEPTP